MAELAILDVGHGNCAVLYHGNRAVVVDAGPGSGDILVDFLEDREIKCIEAVIISHAHDDHLSGLLTLLADARKFEVRRILINPDPANKTKLMRMVRQAIRGAKLRSPAVSERRYQPKQRCWPIPFHAVARVEILAPESVKAMTGIGGEDLNGRRIGVHSQNAVVRIIIIQGEAVAVLPGDLDSDGLNFLETQIESCRAAALVYPHHGGHSGSSDDRAFARRLHAVVQPTLVVFSMGRSRFQNPLPETVSALMAADPSLHIMCTQLSERCSSHAPTFTDRLMRIPAAGKKDGVCCAGTIVLGVRNGNVSISPESSDHDDFISRHVVTPLCKPERHR